jgi:hypothetical protein
MEVYMAIEIEEVNLNITLPASDIRMVIMQPFIELDGNGPFRWKANKKQKQIDGIGRTLEIAKKQEFDCEKTNFVLFPEYTIPGLDGVNHIENLLNNDSWKSNTIVIGGIDGLTKQEYECLCNNAQVNKKNKPDKVQDGKWLNCCIVWTKDKEKNLKKWIQPKLVPAWPEKNINNEHMFCGKSIYLFKGNFENGVNFHFLSLICFDWIGQLGEMSGIKAVTR